MLHYEVWTTYSRAVDRDLFMDLFLKLTEYHSKWTNGGSLCLMHDCNVSSGRLQGLSGSVIVLLATNKTQQNSE